VARSIRLPWLKLAVVAATDIAAVSRRWQKQQRFLDDNIKDKSHPN
jgi:hypothetical protein